MAARRDKEGKRKAALSPPPPAAAATTTSGNIADVLAQASACAECGELDEAADLFGRAASMSPRSVDILDSLAEALMEAGRPGEAAAALRRAIDLAPQAGFEKYMYLAQLLGNTMEAVDVSRAGVDVLRRERSALPPAGGDAAARRAELADFEASALCGIAEVLLGVIEESQDQAVADRLDGQAEAAIGGALAVSAAGSQGELEASMALANLRLSQARGADARVAMARVAAAMRPALDVLDDEDGGDDSIVQGLGMLPPVPMRIAAGQQLVEVELWRDAVSVLSSVLYECDFNVEVWYMLAIAFHRSDERDQALAALESLRAARASPDGFDGNLADGAAEELEAAVRGGGSPGRVRRRGRGSVGDEGEGVDVGDDGRDMRD